MVMSFIIPASLYCSIPSTTADSSGYLITIHHITPRNSSHSITITNPTTHESFTKWTMYNAANKIYFMSFSGDITKPLVDAMKEYESNQTKK